MGRKVMFVTDDDLPEGCDWFMAKPPGGDYIFAVNPEAITEDLLHEAWEAYACLARRCRD